MVCLSECVCVSTLNRIGGWNVPLNKVAHTACETVEKGEQSAGTEIY